MVDLSAVSVKRISAYLCLLCIYTETLFVNMQFDPICRKCIINMRQATEKALKVKKAMLSRGDFFACLSVLSFLSVSLCV